MLASLLRFALVQSALSQPNSISTQVEPVSRLQLIVDRVISSVLQEFAAQHLQPDQIAVTLVDLREPTRPESAGYRGTEPIYPASIIKMFYLVAAHRWLEDGRLTNTEELRRALRDMIVDSSNEATGYIPNYWQLSTSGATFLQASSIWCLTLPSCASKPDQILTYLKCLIMKM